MTLATSITPRTGTAGAAAVAPSRSIIEHLCTEWRLKCRLSVTLALFFCVPYFLLQWKPRGPIRTLDPLWIDAWIGFSPGWVWVYQSVYLLIAIVPWLVTAREALTRYARGFVAMSSVVFLCFFFFPIEGPRPEDVPQSGMFAWLVWYDRPLNAFPSLHSGLAAYSVLLLAEVTRGTLAGARVRALPVAAATAWLGAILYATLATKQHFAVDLPGGLLLAWLCHKWAWSAQPLGSAAGSSTRAARVDRSWGTAK